MSSREFWAAEAAKMRDTSALFDMSHLASSATNKKESAAWKISNSWNESWIKIYRNEVNSLIAIMESTGDAYSCEDFALSCIMNFARKKELPFKWETGSETFDASESGYKDAEKFTEAVMKATGAKDFQRSVNTSIVGKENAQIGDLVVMSQIEDKGVASHIQVIVKTEGTPNVSLDIKQGNLNSRFSIHFGTARLITSGTHLLKRDIFFSKGDNMLENPTHTYSPLSATYMFKTQTFNFIKWNN